MSVTSTQTLFDFAGLPTKAALYLLDQIGQTVGEPTLSCLLRVNHAMYDTFAPYLYRKLEINARNNQKIFYGLNYDIDQEAQWSGGEHSNIIAHASALASHYRKIKLLNLVKTLVITDFEGAEAIAKSIHPEPFDEIAHDEVTRRYTNGVEVKRGLVEAKPMNPLIFLNVENVGLGLSLLSEESIFPVCNFHVHPNPHPVVSVLRIGLNPQHICYDHEASSLFINEQQSYQERFELGLGLLVGNWRFKSCTIHQMDEIPFPCEHGIIRIRVFYTDIPPETEEEDEVQILSRIIADFIDSTYWCCVHPQKDEKTKIEIICPGYQGYEITPEDIVEAGNKRFSGGFRSFSCGKDSLEVCMEAADRRWEKRKTSGWFEDYFSIVAWEEAEPCVCCGMK
ncbi:uncharacterized protein IL334_001449 [Kwoniella shivajii]|uniref:Uncharacterized protein n=1 Tax=Kwoniella shivajii TaxID=564305 RepID=A0ABZ1CT40_9TREE|nr:hypothetical protein IL334_001449 [Kwoniella shivajii]